MAVQRKTAAQTTLSNLALLFPEEDKKPEQASQVRACACKRCGSRVLVGEGADSRVLS